MKYLSKTLQAGWLEPNWLTYFLLPFTLLYRLLMAIRYKLYTSGVFGVYKSPVPVLVVGNISVGGTGKTPLTMKIVNLAKEMGFKPGVISRGYGGQNMEWPQLVSSNSSPYYLGDEPVLISKSTACPVAVGPKRGDVIDLLLNKHNCDLIISDDGLQHYALDRDIELAVYDSQRRHLNRFCLPSGPLREPESRLKTVDLVMKHVSPESNEFESENSAQFKLMPEGISPLNESSQLQLVSHSGQKVHAVAGIGHPSRFFKQLAQLGFDVIEHPFSDHHHYESSDFEFGDNYPVIMTEKDSIKCYSFSKDNWFSFAVSAELNSFAEKSIKNLLLALNKS